jgi:hypothetical protein
MPKSAKLSSKPAKRGGKAIPYSFCSRNVPDAQYVTLTYSSNLDVAATANFYSYQWRLNSPYDCDYTSTGTQPVSFDEWTALYGRYLVYSADVETRVVNRQAGSVAYAAFVIDGLNNAPSYTSFVQASEQRHSVKSETQYGAPPAVLKIKRNVHDVFGVPLTAVESDDTYAGTSSSNPSKVLWGSVDIYTAGATDALSIYSVIKMKVKFWAPTAPALSLTRNPRQGSDEERGEATTVATATPLGSTAVPCPVGPANSCPVPAAVLQAYQALVAASPKGQRG